jgi:hypothetical protein
LLVHGSTWAGCLPRRWGTSRIAHTEPAGIRSAPKSLDVESRSGRLTRYASYPDSEDVTRRPPTGAGHLPTLRGSLLRVSWGRGRTRVRGPVRRLPVPRPAGEPAHARPGEPLPRCSRHLINFRLTRGMPVARSRSPFLAAATSSSDERFLRVVGADPDATATTRAAHTIPLVSQGLRTVRLVVEDDSGTTVQAVSHLTGINFHSPHK